MTELQASLIYIEPYPSLLKLVRAQHEFSPRYRTFLERRFSTAPARDLSLADELASRILRLAGQELEAFLKGYDFICDIMKAEELHFRRNNEYRVKTAQGAFEAVYSDETYMRNYMRGLLLTQVFWSNHTASMAFYLDNYLAQNPSGYAHLEIGPGHGLLLERAIANARAGSITAWDISPASVDETRVALRKLGVDAGVSLEVQDLFAAKGAQERFDGVVLSEVLEHLENPAGALDAVNGIMRSGARLYVNVPLNSPAPDHIFLLRTPEEAVALVESAGFEIAVTDLYPATNYSLAAARKHALTISVCIVARKPA